MNSESKTAYNYNKRVLMYISIENIDMYNYFTFILDIDYTRGDPFQISTKCEF